MIRLGEVTGRGATLWQKHSRPFLLRASLGGLGGGPREVPAEQRAWERGGAGSLHWEGTRCGGGGRGEGAPSGPEGRGSAAPWRQRSGIADLCPRVARSCDLIPLSRGRAAEPLEPTDRWDPPHRRPRPLSCLSGSRDQTLPACRDLRSMRPAGLECPRMPCLWPPLRLLLLLLLWLLPQPVTRAQTKPGAPSAPMALGTPAALDTPTALATPSALPTPGTPSAKTGPEAPSDATAPSTPSAPTSPGTPSTPNLREHARALMRDFPLVDGCVGVVGAELPPGLGRGCPHMDVLSLLCHPLPVGNARAQASQGPGIACVTVWGGERLAGPGWPPVLPDVRA